MKIESMEELLKRVTKTLKSLADADEYDQSREILAGFLNGDDKDFFFLEDAEMQLVEALMDADGDFYQQKNLEHVLQTEEKILKEIKEGKLPDLSWAGYEG